MARKAYRARFPLRKLNRKVDFKRNIISRLPRASGGRGKGLSRREQTRKH